MKKIFGFDLDGVLYDFHKPAYDYCKLYKNETKDLYTFWEDAMQDRDGYSPLFWKNLVRIPTLYSKYPAKKEDVETLHEIKKFFDIVYISHRPMEVYHTTKLWLKTYDLPDYESLYLTNLPKHIAVRVYNCAHYVEDRREILTSPLRNVTNLIAKRTLWNWDECESLPYVDTIPELLNIIEEIK